jgi:hypothetical protein
MQYIRWLTADPTQKTKTKTNCPDTLVLAHPFRALVTFTVCFSVHSCWTNTAMYLLLTWVQNGPVGFKKITPHLKNQYMCWMMIVLCQWDWNGDCVLKLGLKWRLCSEIGTEMAIVLCQWDWNGDCVVSVGLKWRFCCVIGTEMAIVLCQWDWNGDCVVSVGLKWRLCLVSGTEMAIVLCQWDCNGQIQKLVRLLLCTSEKCSRKFQWLIERVVWGGVK